MKSCIECKITKSLFEFVKRKESKDGRRNICKKCQSIKINNLSEEKKEFKRLQNKKWREKNKEKIKEDKHNYHLKNAEKINKAKKLYRINNLELVKNQERISGRKYVHKNKERIKENRDKNKEKKRLYDEKYRKLNIEKRKFEQKLWKKINKDKVYESVRNRYLLKIQAVPSWVDRKSIASFYKTADALSMHTGDFYHVDHIVPLRSKIVCGLHCQANLQVITAKENLSKSNLWWPDMP